MLEVLVDHRNGCRICVADDPQGCVPYPPARSVGDANTGYKPLREVPSLIDGLHEVRQFPALGPALRAINGKDSPWESIGCGPGQYERKNVPGSYIAGTYIHLIFCCRLLNLFQANHRKVAIELGSRWVSQDKVGIDFIVDPLSNFWGRSDAWALKIEVAGLGQSFDAAWKAAEQGVESFLVTFMSIDLHAVLGEQSSRN